MRSDKKKSRVGERGASAFRKWLVKTKPFSGIASGKVGWGFLRSCRVLSRKCKTVGHSVTSVFHSCYDTGAVPHRGTVPYRATVPCRRAVPCRGTVLCRGTAPCRVLYLGGVPYLILAKLFLADGVHPKKILLCPTLLEYHFGCTKHSCIPMPYRGMYVGHGVLLIALAVRFFLGIVSFFFLYVRHGVP